MTVPITATLALFCVSPTITSQPLCSIRKLSSFIYRKISYSTGESRRIFSKVEQKYSYSNNCRSFLSFKTSVMGSSTLKDNETLFLFDVDGTLTLPRQVS
jgi:hypothetical protein